MSNIIDALVVTLGLDPAGFKRGAAEADATFKKSKENADKTAKDMEAKAKIAGQVFDKVRNQVLALAGAVTAGVGLKNFLESLTSTDAAAGRTARNIGVATETLTAWQGVAERAGGSAAGMAGSMQGLSQQFQQLALTGTSAVVPFFRAVGVPLADANGKMRAMDDILLDLSDHFSKMDPARAQALGRGMGLDEGTINVLIQGRTAIAALLAEQQKLGAANKKDADAAAERQKAMRGLGQASEDLGRKLLTALTPALGTALKILTAMAEWFSTHPTIFAVFATTVAAAAAILTAALVVLQVKGFLGLIGALGKVPAAAAAASTAMEASAAASSGGLLAMLGALATSAALVAVAGAVGYAIGTAIYKGIEGTKFADKIGEFVTATLAAFGNEDAQAAIETELNAKAGLGDMKTGPRRRVGQADAGAAPPTATPPARTASPSNAPANPKQAQADIERFMAMGWTRAQATGIAANIQRESAGNEKAVGDQGSAFGLAQWHPDRQREFAKQFGKDIRSASRDEQLQFINYELRQGNEKAAGAALARAADPATAAAVISRKYERPGDVEGEAAKRASLATSLYRPAPDPALRGGAATALAANTQTTNTSSSTHSSEVSIGEVNVNLPNATDGPSVAQGLAPALKKSMSFAAQANSGLTS